MIDGKARSSWAGFDDRCSEMIGDSDAVISHQGAGHLNGSLEFGFWQEAGRVLGDNQAWPFAETILGYDT